MSRDSFSEALVVAMAGLSSCYSRLSDCFSPADCLAAGGHRGYSSSLTFSMEDSVCDFFLRIIAYLAVCLLVLFLPKAVNSNGNFS